MKIYELAKELGISSKELMVTIAKLGIAAPSNHFASISDQDANSVRRHVLRGALRLVSSENDENIQPETIETRTEQTEHLVIRRKKTGQNRRISRSEKVVSSKTGKRNFQLPEQFLGISLPIEDDKKK